MKKINLILITLLALVACKKEKSNHSGGSIILASKQTVNGNTYSVQDSVIVAGLMAANNLSSDGFMFYAYQSYNAFDQNNKMGFFQLTTARQIRNSLPVFFEDITFGFENGKLNGPYPASQFIAGNITLDNKPTLALQTLRETFIKIDNAREAYNISIGDSTLIAQLGYYNLNTNQLPDGGKPGYIKAWYVHPQHSSWPEGYFRDDTGVSISFKPLTHSGPVTP